MDADPYLGPCLRARRPIFKCQFIFVRPRFPNCLSQNVPSDVHAHK